ncbi:MAG: calcium/sodium antiporter [Verrucomicrobia bacterium]|nr:calcium/sodium antiporter [Verrucomicrobiota bacterium]
MTFLWFIIGLGVLVAGAELLVRGASRLALAFGISPLVIGLTIVAFGTSTPEVAVGVKAVLVNQPDLVTGNCLGSTMFNVLLILGACAVIAPLVVAQQLVRLDVPIMIGVHVLLLALGLDGKISRLDGLILFAGVVAYSIFAIRKGKKESPAVTAEYDTAYGKRKPGRSPGELALHAGLIVGGLALCVLGARWMVDSAVMLARAWGVSELVIGLTIVAAGTSMPEVATSIVATFRGQRDIAIGNVVGSNIFNILGIVGVAGLVAPDGIAVAPSVLRFDLPVAIAVCVACLPIFFTGHSISRWEGAVFLGYYVAYTAYLILAAQQHDALPAFSAVMKWFVLPLTVVTLAVVTWRAVRARQEAP